MKVVIGMPQMGNNLFRKYMKSKYEQSVIRAGAEVRWISLEDPEQAAVQLLSCDGLLLPGGADVAPHLYGQVPSEKCGKPNALRDTAEMKMLEAFLPTGKPIFCICRGVQLLNVFCGGTLHQDIKEIQTDKHSDFSSRKKGIHNISIAPDTKLHTIIGSDTIRVNSMHHQAADSLGNGLIRSAVSEDGITEALEFKNHPFCVGVQWHPEHMSQIHPAQQRLFDAFIAACKKSGSPV